MNDKPDESANSSGPEQNDSPAAAPAEKAQQAGTAAEGQSKGSAELKAENADLRDRLLRAIAEMENFRRRAERERADVSKYAISGFARDAVSIGDNISRAIEVAKKEPLEQSPALKTLLEGLEATERELLRVFERHGVTRFDPLGEKFDPHMHEAMVKVDVPNAPADTIVQVLQSGYKIGDRVLRPAAVIVATGAPGKGERPAEGSEDDENEARSSAENKGGPLQSVHEHDPDVIRDARGAPKGGAAQSRGRERQAAEKRSSTVTQPITETTEPLKKDDLVSSFGKRLENGS